MSIVTVLAVYGCGEDRPTGPQTLPGVIITVTPTQLNLTIGRSAELKASVTDLAGRLLSDQSVKWSSSAADIVSVSAEGIITALKVGSASIGAYSNQGVGFAYVVVPMSFRLPLRPAIVVTEMGTPTSACPGNEGGSRINGGWDCSHSGYSRYSLDLANPEQWAGAPSRDTDPVVVAAADGVIASVCLQPPNIRCGPDGPYIVVEHPGDFLTIYGHLDAESVTLRRKTPVVRGQPLGKMGSSREDAAPWLHFELRYNNQGAGAASVLDPIHLGEWTFQDFKAGAVY